MGSIEQENRIQDSQAGSHLGGHSHRGKVFPVTRKSRKFFSYCGSSTDSFSHCTVSSMVQLWTGRAKNVKKMEVISFLENKWLMLYNRVKIFNMSHVFCEFYIDKHKVGLNLEMQDGDTLSNTRNI